MTCLVASIIQKVCEVSKMAKIVLVLYDVKNQKFEVLRRLGSVAATGNVVAMEAIAKQEPVFARRLFDRQDAEFPDKLLTLLEWLESQSLPYKAFQILDHEDFDWGNTSKYYQLDADRLRTRILTRRLSIEQQEESARLEEGIEE